MAECESHKQSPVHLLIAVGHGLESLLLLVNFLVLGHVGLIGKVVEVAGVGLRVQLGNKGGASLAEGLPLDFGKVLVIIDVFDITEATASGVDATDWSVQRQS